MARLLLLLERGVMAGHGNGFGSWPSMPLAIGLFVAVGVLMGLCAHQPAAKEKPDSPANKTSSKKLVTRTFSRNKTNSQKKREVGGGGDDHEHEIRVDISAQVPVPLSPPPPPPQRKNSKDGGRKEGSGGGYEKKGKMGGEKVSRGGFGEGGLWQKSILRGEKCQLPEFSGVIFYDSKGNQLHLTG